MQLDGSGYPVVDYGNGGNAALKVAHCGNASCSSGNVISTAAGYGLDPSLRLDSAGNPVVASLGSSRPLNLTHCTTVNCR